MRDIAILRRRRVVAPVALVLMMVWLTRPATAAPPENQIIAVFDEQAVEFDKELIDGTQKENVRLFRNGQQIERSITLPALPANMRDAMHIVATLIVDPVVLEENAMVRPADPWTRLGSITIAAPRSIISPNNRPDAQPPGASTQPAATQPSYPATTAASDEIELMRFVTPFGGPATFTADLTAFAPLLAGETSLRVWISTWKQPAWKVTLTLSYTAEGVGYRRPRWATPIFNSEVTSTASKLTTTIEVPKGLSRPRLHVLSTGHATDGAGGDEFITRSHVLRIDGNEVARWRPWSENGGRLRSANPTSGRSEKIDGRELWVSDLDRSGWHPGLLVDPMPIPLPELGPGKHTIELEILNIRPKDQSGYGYWRVSAIAVADEPWPPDVESPGGPGPQ